MRRFVLGALLIGLTFHAAVLAAPDDEVRVRLVEDFLAPRWQLARQGGDQPAGAVQD